MRFSNFDEVLSRAASHPRPRRAAVAGAADPHVIEAVLDAKHRRIAEPVLVGNPGEIAALLVKHNEKADAFTIVPADGQAECGRTAVELVRDGRADFLMKGFVETRDLLRPLVKKENGLNLGRTISHMAFLQVPGIDHLLVITDGGMVIHPSREEKRDILHNAFELLRRIGYENPAAAAVCAVEHPDPKMPETMDASRLAAMNREGQLTGGEVWGPISYDLAMSAEIARIKHYDCSRCGDFDILLSHDMACGNILAKSLILNAGALMAGLVVGAKVPVVLNSRGSSAAEKVLSLALAAVSAENREGGAL